MRLLRSLVCLLAGHKEAYDYGHIAGFHYFCGRCGEELD